MHRSTVLTILGLCGAAVGACRSAGTPASSDTAATAGGNGSMAIAGDESGEPGFRFTPRKHPARRHIVPPPPPALGSLPRMQNRISQCFGIEEHEAAPIASGPGRGYSSGAGVGYGAGGGRVAKPRQTPSSLRRKAEASQRPTASAAPPPAAPEPASAAPSRQSRAADGVAESSGATGNAKKDVGRAQRPAEEAEGPIALARDEDDAASGYHDWGASIYLSNDDTMSLSSAQRVIYAIDHFMPLPPEHIRPHEVLNYFSFETAPVQPENDFSVAASIAQSPGEPGIHTLALAVSGRPMDVETRRNANLSIVVDRSGSMQAEGRMEYLKRGLSRMVSELKRGDIVHLTLFDHSVCVPVENFVVGRDPMPVLEEAISLLSPLGSTDLHSGLSRGYEIADRAYQPAYTNRVVMITDALTNTGVTDESLIAIIGKYYDQRRIRLSGVGVGTDFNDALLDRLTERGKGAYVFLGSEAEVDAVFGDRFVSLIETTATDVHFRLHLPPSLRMNVFYGEESSVNKEDVQSIHYFANTSQLFLSDVMAKEGRLRPRDQIMLTIEYEHPESGQEMVEEYAFSVGAIENANRNVQKGQLVMRFIDGLADLAARPSQYGTVPGSWDDSEAFALCDTGSRDLSRLAGALDEDPEARRVVGLWERYCSRYERPRDPVRRPRPASGGWPSAQGR